MQDGQDIKVADDEEDDIVGGDIKVKDDEFSPERDQQNIDGNEDIQQVMPTSTPGGNIEGGDLVQQVMKQRQESTAEEIIADIGKIGDFFRSAQFSRALSILQQKLVSIHTC